MPCSSMKLALAKPQENEVELLDIQGLISIKVRASSETAPLIDHLSTGNLGFLGVITEQRKLRIYWPRPEILRLDDAEADQQMITTN